MKILIVDNNEIFNCGLTTILNSLPGVNKVLSKWERIEDIFKLLARTKPDIILIDILILNLWGPKTIKMIQAEFPHIKKVMLSLYNDEAFIMEMKEAGINGFLSKHSGRKEILNCIKAISRGEFFFCKNSLIKLTAFLDCGVGEPASNLFCEKELMIIRLLCKEMTVKEISKELYMSPRTVESYKSRIMQKTNSKTTTGIILYSLKNRIITL